jgi:glycosyltransferase involved in cell wall biosynthesis
MLGLAEALKDEATTHFLSFNEGGRCRPFLTVAKRQGFEAAALKADTPWFRSAVREITEYLTQVRADVLLCHGYKADILGRPAARRAHTPVVSVSRGWTAESFKIRLYERLDRFCLRWMDRVVCVSEAQAGRVLQAGVKEDRVEVIPNAINPDRFDDPDPTYHRKLHRYFRQPRTRIVGAAGRLSPEKGYDILLDAAQRVLTIDPTIGFVLFGEGPRKPEIIEQIQQRGLVGSFILCGFRTDLDRFMPFFDLFVLPSYTEGMPNVILEAFAAGTPVVATAVGGTPELVEDGRSGFLVPPGDPESLGEKITEALASEDLLRDMGMQGRERVLQNHSFDTQADLYLGLFDQLLGLGGHQPPADEPEPPPEPVPEQPVLKDLT